MPAPGPAPTFADGGPQAFWFGRADTPKMRFYATSPNTFIVRLQNTLRAHRYLVPVSYAAGVRFEPDRLSGGRHWGPVTNAALWRYIFEKAYGNLTPEQQREAYNARSDYSIITRRYLDAIERVIAQRRISREALEAAAFVWLQDLPGQPPMSWQRFVSGPTAAIFIPRDVVPPVYEREPPRPDGPFFGYGGSMEYTAWNEDQPIPQIELALGPGGAEPRVATDPVPRPTTPAPRPVRPASPTAPPGPKEDLPLAVYVVGGLVAATGVWFALDAVRRNRRLASQPGEPR